MRWRVVAVPIAISILAAGCGSSKIYPPAAEPPASPVPKLKPLGKIVRVGAQPEGLAADARSGRVAVGLRNPDRLRLINGRDGRVLGRVPLDDSPRHLSLARPGGPVLVPAERANKLIEVNLDGRIDGDPVAVGRFPHDATAAGGRIFVANEMQNTLSVIESGRVVRTLEAPLQPGGLAATANGKVVVVAVRQRVLRSYNARTLEPEQTVSGGVGPTHVVSDCSQRVYVADTEGHAVLAYRVNPKLSFADRINLPAAPYGIAVDCRRRLLWVTEPKRNRLVELRIPREQGAVRLVRTYATVRQPNSVATDEATGRVFVASRTDGVLQILDPRPAKATR